MDQQQAAYFYPAPLGPGSGLTKRIPGASDPTGLGIPLTKNPPPLPVLRASLRKGPALPPYAQTPSRYHQHPQAVCGAGAAGFAVHKVGSLAAGGVLGGAPTMDGGGGHNPLRLNTAVNNIIYEDNSHVSHYQLAQSPRNDKKLIRSWNFSW